MNKLIGVVGVTSLANGGLQDTASLKLYRATCRAHTAAKECFRHFGYQIGQSDDHSGHGDQLIDVGRVQASHACYLVHIERPHSNVHVVVGKLGKIKLLHGRVERLHHLNRIADELLIQFRVEMLQMKAVKVEERLLDQVHLFKFGM